MFGTYERLNVHVYASNRQVIAAASRKLKPAVRHTREHRKARHAFYRQMLQYHRDARMLVHRFRL